MEQKIIDNPGQWIITKKGDFVRIKDSEISVDKKLEIIRQKLSSSGRFKGKTPEQISKERYDKVWEEVNFDTEKLHDWLYDEKNKDKVEIIPRKMIYSGWEYEIDEVEYQRDVNAIFNHVKSSKQKWRERNEKKFANWDLQNWYVLVNEETGQVIWPSAFVDKEYSKLRKANQKLIEENWVPMKRGFNKDAILIDWAGERGNTNKTGDNKYNSVVIFLHGTYGAEGSFPQIEKSFPNTKFIALCKINVSFLNQSNS